MIKGLLKLTLEEKSERNKEISHTDICGRELRKREQQHESRKAGV